MLWPFAQALQRNSVVLGLLLLGCVAGTWDLSDVEQKFLSVPASASAEAHLRYITSRPHVAGTAGDFVMAEYVRAQMALYGLDSKIENVTVFLNYPEEPPQLTFLGVGGGGNRSIELAEPVLPADHTSDTPWRNHTFHGYAPSGDALGPLVYANYGLPSDFEELKKLGVDVSGKLVLVRYGECFRGLKVRNAQAQGAAGVLIYSDPEDDGFDLGKSYPEGPWRPSFGQQRGSVQFNSLCSGDPARVSGPRPVEELCGYKMEELIPKIPSIPLSYGAAQDLLSKLGGPVAPKGFQGGLPLNYSVGPSSSFELKLRTRHRNVNTPIPNVITTIAGRGAQQRPVILGNHRDAWVYGAADPNSGTASLLELARGLGELQRTGWQPERTIILCSWSGEEYGLVGSTAWAEHNEPLVSQAIAYLNVDVAVSGNHLTAGGTFALRDLFQSAAAAVEAPGGGRLAQMDPWAPIGSGSDYAVFLDHFGVASMDFSFARVGAKGKEAAYGQYHSVYDSFDWMARFGAGGEGAGQPGQAFAYMQAAGQLWGLVALRLADAAVLPFNHSAQAEALEGWRAELAAEAPGLDTSELKAAIAAYARSAELVASAAASAAAAQRRASSSAAAAGAAGRGAPLAALNDRLAFTERRFLVEEGLAERRWFRSLLQAPGIDEGYAPQPFPGVRDALRPRGAGAEAAQLQVAALAVGVREAAAFLGGGGGGSLGRDEIVV